MAQVLLQAGDMFQQAWRGCTKPMWFRVLSVCREKNSVTVECHTAEGYSYNETWDDLDITELSFETGEYKMIAR